MLIADPVPIRVSPLGAIEREDVDVLSTNDDFTGPLWCSVLVPRDVLVVVAVAIAIGIVPLGCIVRECITTLVDVNLILVDFIEVVVAVSVVVGIDPLFLVVWSPIVDVGPTVTVRICASKSVFCAVPKIVRTFVRLECRCRVVTVSVAVRVVPLSSFRWECVNDPISLVGGVVPIIVLVNIGKPEVDALVVSTMSCDNACVIRAPCNAVDCSTIVVVTGLAIPWSWA